MRRRPDIRIPAITRKAGRCLAKPVGVAGTKGDGELLLEKKQNEGQPRDEYPHRRRKTAADGRAQVPADGVERNRDDRTANRSGDQASRDVPNDTETTSAASAETAPGEQRDAPYSDRDKKR